METVTKYQARTYKYGEVCHFRKTKELNGGLSNMASGFPIKVNGIYMLTSEALYQSCRFPHLPEVQKKIIDEKSPMTAKMVGKCSCTGCGIGDLLSVLRSTHLRFAVGHVEPGDFEHGWLLSGPDRRQ